VSDVIELRGLRVSAIVGVLAREREQPQPLSIDLDLERPFAAAAAGDRLEDTTNYAAVLSVATTTAVEGRFLLLETLADRIARNVLELDGAISAVTVVARKLRPPVQEDVATVGVRTRVARA
jgi:7,8-dihydroneopterin aldolase/epimerase/oxygenase